MDSIYKNDKDREINKPETTDFSIKTKGLYLVKISARVKGEKQLGGTDDEDLKIEIDNRKFTQPAAFSGGNLHSLKKTIFFALPFDSGKHTISLIPDISATLLAVQISKIDEDSNLNLVLDDKAEDGDRRPWITFVLVDLSLDRFTTKLTLKRRFIDSDDVKIIINDKIERNNQSKLHKLWYFIASLFTGEIQTETFIVNLSKNTHYIEFWADRMPTLHKISFDGLTYLEIKDATKNLSPEEAIKAKIIAEAGQVSLDPELMISIATWESHFDPKAASPAGAKGIFQLTPITIKEIENRFSFRIVDPFDVDQNIKGAMPYFKWLMDRYEGDPEQVEKALVAWNWGLNNFPVDPPLDWSKVPSETKAFVKNVLNK